MHCHHSHILQISLHNIWGGWEGRSHVLDTHLYARYYTNFWISQCSVDSNCIIIWAGSQMPAHQLKQLTVCELHQLRNIAFEMT